MGSKHVKSEQRGKSPFVTVNWFSIVYGKLESANYNWERIIILHFFFIKRVVAFEALDNDFFYHQPFI